MPQIPLGIKISEDDFIVENEEMKLKKSDSQNFKEITAVDYKEDNDEQTITFKITAPSNTYKAVEFFISNGQIYASNEPTILTLEDNSIASNKFINTYMSNNEINYMIISKKLEWDSNKENYIITFKGFWFIKDGDIYKKQINYPNTSNPEFIFIKDISELRLKYKELTSY